MNQPSSDVIVNAGCLLFFHGQPHDQDVLDSTLYVQLAASRKHSRFAEYPQWKATWLQAALRFGWLSQASESFLQPAPELTTATLWDWARAWRPGFVSAALLERSEAALADCQALQPAFELFASQVLAPEGTTLALQLGLVDTDDSLTLLQLHFTSRCALGADELLGPWCRERIRGNVSLGFHRLILSHTLYAPLREAFAKALRDRRPGLVMPLARRAEMP
ncbi:hypothetical protein [uncultured Pseudomonas sp.]|uniref:hypothetical protein n=1 Tax=uncultured Pseudomonas sp. TaxID=114707 RepID=UPI0025E0CCDB|nr:hypothetical protein [uncultured Pseudomonas sp.]